MVTLGDFGEQGETVWSAADAGLVARSLYTIWAVRTGRRLRDVPVSELTPEELVDFWADDELEEPYASTVYLQERS
jgi:hypothetical protein